MLTSLSNVSIAQWVQQTGGTTADLFDVSFCSFSTGIGVTFQADSYEINWNVSVLQLKN